MTKGYYGYYTKIYRFSERCGQVVPSKKKEKQLIDYGLIASLQPTRGTHTAGFKGPAKRQ